MITYTSCPRCGESLTQERFATGSAICQCGWSDPSPSLKAREKSDRKAIQVMIVGAIALAAAYAHLVNWGTYALSIPVVKAEQWTGTLSKEGYNELAKACLGLGKISCAKNAYLELYQSKKDVDGLASLAKLQIRLNDNETGLRTFSAYFQAGGASADASLHYGRALEEAGRTDEAISFYEKSIAVSGETLPVQATTGIVRILMKQGQYENALSRIQAFHESAGNAKGYLNTELTQLEQYLAQQAAKNDKHGAKNTAVGRKRVAQL